MKLPGDQPSQPKHRAAGKAAGPKHKASVAQHVARMAARRAGEPRHGTPQHGASAGAAEPGAEATPSQSNESSWSEVVQEDVLDEGRNDTWEPQLKQGRKALSARGRRRIHAVSVSEWGAVKHINPHKRRMSLPRRIALGLSVALLCLGVSIIMYPIVNQLLYDHKVSELVEEFDALAEELRQNQASAAEAEGTYLDLSGLREAMEAYNLDLYENGQAGFRDAWSYQVPSFDLTEWGLPDNMVGYLSIPSMGVTLPVYLGANDATMEAGAAHLSQTSLPIGGTNANAVIAAHRGMRNGVSMFLNIEMISLGDYV